MTVYTYIQLVYIYQGGFKSGVFKNEKNISKHVIFTDLFK